MATPDLHLRTCFVLDASGRIVATREPSTSPAPTFCFVRDARTCAWAVHADVLGDIAAEVEALETWWRTSAERTPLLFIH